MVNRARIVAVAALVAASLIATALPAQAAVDIRLGYHSPTASPDGSIAYFAGYATGKGVELYKTDGTASGTVLVKDINPGKRNAFLANAGSTDFAQFTYLGDKVFFYATDATGRNLWVSDGTAAGTKRLTTAGASKSLKRELVAFEGNVYFSAYTKGSVGWAIWKSDGTLAGTKLAYNTSVRIDEPQGFTVAGDKLFVFAGTEVDIPGLYVIENDTITQLKRIHDRTNNKREIPAIVVDGLLYFIDQDEAWRSDGTVAGTVRLNGRAGNLFSLDGVVHVAGYMGSTAGLWKLVGNDFELVTELPATSAQTLKSEIELVGDTFSYLAFDTSSKVGSLMAKSPSDDGFVKIRDIFVAPTKRADIYPAEIFEYRPIAFNGKTYFWSQFSLWESDGTAEGTRVVKNFGFTKVQVSPMELAVVNDTLIATGRDQYKHSTLWLSDGTEAGTYQRLATGVMSAVSPSFTGTPTVGATLTGRIGKWTPAPTSWKYQWKINGVPVEGANTLTFVVPEVPIGSKIQLTASGFRSGYQTINRTSQARPTVALFDAPVPTISGTYAAGEVLTVNAGTWTPAATLSYQWYANGKAIAGKTASTYQLTAGSVLRSITVTVTGKKTGYATLTRTSLPAQ